MVWYSHLLKNFPVCCDPYKGFGIVNKAEVDVFLEFSCFISEPADAGNLISGSSAFSKSSLNFWKFTVHVLLYRKKCIKKLYRKKCINPIMYVSSCQLPEITIVNSLIHIFQYFSYIPYMPALAFFLVICPCSCQNTIRLFIYLLPQFFSKFLKGKDSYSFCSFSIYCRA